MRTRSLGAGILIIAMVAPGCTLLSAKRDIEQVEHAISVRGTVTAPSDQPKPIAVVLLAEKDGHKVLRSYYVRRGSGPFHFLIKAGTAFLFAFEDSDESLSYQKGEPAAWYGGKAAQAIVAGDKNVLEDLDIRLSTDVPEGVDELIAMAAKGAQGNPDLVKIRRGDLAKLDDPRFTLEVGKKGLWTPLEFSNEYGAGIYFLQAFDPKKIPILFVHGAAGFPAAFETIISKLDQEHFQPWVFHYPSGMRLGLASDLLRRVLDELQLRYRFEQMFVVAHSMGGLVSRAALNEITGRGHDSFVTLFVSISTPWQGHEAAEMGTKRSPVVVPSWFDMVPRSPFLRVALEKPLPIPHYLFFSFLGGSGTDGAVSLASELDEAAQDGATAIYGFPEDHMSILKSKGLIAKLNFLFEQGRNRPRPPSERAGRPRSQGITN